MTVSVKLYTATHTFIHYTVLERSINALTFLLTYLHLSLRLTRPNPNPNSRVKPILGPIRISVDDDACDQTINSTRAA